MLKKLGIVLLTIFCMLPVTEATVKAESNTIENDETGIPDTVLYKRILKSLKKKKGDKFTRKEAEKVENLYTTSLDNVQTFRGIGCLKNLKKLDCEGIDNKELEEIAAELPNLKWIIIRGYNEKTYDTVDPPVESRKKQIDSLEPLKNMKNLRGLSVSNNNLTNLNGIEGMKHLKRLKAENNQIVNVEGIKGLKNLKEVYLSNNQIASLDGINKLTKLIYLDLSNNLLTNVKGIGKLKKLKELRLTGNRLSDTSGMKSLKSLKILSLDHNKLKKLGEVGQIKCLNYLYMNGNQLTGTKGIKNLKNLEGLSLNQNRLTKLGEISQLKKLVSLSLSANKIKSLSDSDLKNLKKLKSLDLYDNELRKLPGKKSLKNLYIADFNWNYLTKKEIKKKLKKRLWEGHSLCRWMWEEQKTDIRIAYLSPDQKTNITKDTTEIVAKITPEQIKGYPPFFYLLLPDGKTIGLEGEKFTAPKADEQGVFRIEGLDLKAYAGEEIGLVALLDYEWDIIMDWFTVQE